MLLTESAYEDTTVHLKSGKKKKNGHMLISCCAGNEEELSTIKKQQSHRFPCESEQMSLYVTVVFVSFFEVRAV